MLILGGIVGFVLCFFLVAVPLAGTMATQLGITLVLPIVGQAVTPLFMPPVVVGALIHIVLVLICYLIAAVATPVPASGPVPVSPPGAPPAPFQLAERFGRGALVGINAAANVVLLPVAAPWMVSWSPVLLAVAFAAGPLWLIAAVVLLVVDLLALSEALCANASFAAVLGWSAWVAPTTWPATLPGLVVALVNFLPGRPFADVSVGAVLVHGGPIFNWFSSAPQGFNLGNLAFIDGRYGRSAPVLLPGGLTRDTAEGVTFHETGHTLNVAAFGAWFHYIGAIHQNLLGAGPSAYSELLPESRLRRATNPWFPLWPPPGVLTGTTSNTPPVVAGSTVNGVADGLGVAALAVAAGTPIVLSAVVADPDGFPQAIVSPGVIPAVGVLWAFAAQPPGAAPVVVLPNTPATTAIANRGGDHTLALAASDGADLALVSFDFSVVEAQANGPYAGSPNSPVTLSAAGSTAGSNGDLPSLSPFFALTLNWSAPAGTTLDNPASESPTFTASQPGTYTVSLTVTETATGADVSHTDTADIVIS